MTTHRQSVQVNHVVYVDGVVRCHSRLEADGWSLFGGRIIETEEERVYCSKCDRTLEVDWSEVA